MLQESPEMGHITEENDIDCVLLNKICYFKNVIKGSLCPISTDTIIFLLWPQLQEEIMTQCI